MTKSTEGMNRQQRRALAREQHAHVKQFSDVLEPVPPDTFPNMAHLPDKAWVSRKYLVQLYTVPNATIPGLLRLSVNRSRIDTTGKWQAEMTWDELQAIKRDVGYGDWYAVEVYPRDSDVVNVANFRHLWLMPVPLEIGWFK